MLADNFACSNQKLSHLQVYIVNFFRKAWITNKLCLRHFQPNNMSRSAGRHLNHRKSALRTYEHRRPACAEIKTQTGLNLQNYLKNIAEKSDRFLTFRLKRIGFLRQKVSRSDDAYTTYLWFMPKPPCLQTKVLFTSNHVVELIQHSIVVCRPFFMPF